VLLPRPRPCRGITAAIGPGKYIRLGHDERKITPSKESGLPSSRDKARSRSATLALRPNSAHFVAWHQGLGIASAYAAMAAAVRSVGAIKADADARGPDESDEAVLDMALKV
jgi:hypothetical protein